MCRRGVRGVEAGFCWSVKQHGWAYAGVAGMVGWRNKKRGGWAKVRDSARYGFFIPCVNFPTILIQTKFEF
jgi:hypothetical protein